MKRFRNVSNKVSGWKKKAAREMAKNQTFPEKVLWECLKNKKLGVWFYKQKVILGYIVDFWCPAAGLAVEVDGKHHQCQKKYDANRDAVLAGKGIMTVRFPARDVSGSLDNVISEVVVTVKQRLKVRR